MPSVCRNGCCGMAKTALEASGGGILKIFYKPYETLMFRMAAQTGNILYSKISGKKRIMNMKAKHYLPLLLALFFAIGAKGQTVAVKTNLLYDATQTVNAGIEIGLAPKWTFDLSGNYNSWSKSEYKKWKHWMVQPEARYWFCDRFSRHFLGFHALGGEYNVGGLDTDFSIFGTDFSKLKDNRYQGWFAGGGVAYGYALALGKHWNLEFEIGVGYVYTKYDSYECMGCGKKVGTDLVHHYVGPTKGAINLVYIF